MVTTDLVKMSDTEMMNRVNSARFPQELTPTDKKLLVLAAKTYGFDPIMGEISIFQGKPYVTIDGRRRKSQETGNYCGLKTRPATPPEREAWQIPRVITFSMPKSASRAADLTTSRAGDGYAWLR